MVSVGGTRGKCSEGGMESVGSVGLGVLIPQP